MQGLPFLQFGTLAVSADVEFSPLTLQDLKLTGPLTAFGVSGTAEFSASSGSPVVQQDSPAGVGLMAVLPSVDLPLMARSLGANMSLGVLSADLRSVRAQIDPSTSTAVQKKQGAAAPRQQEPGTATLAVAAELRMLGMSSYVNFDMSAQQAATVAATFVAGQINRVSCGQVQGWGQPISSCSAVISCHAAGGHLSFLTASACIAGHSLRQPCSMHALTVLSAVLLPPPL
jgi:hypothetical protein